MYHPTGVQVPQKTDRFIVYNREHNHNDTTQSANVAWCTTFRNMLSMNKHKIWNIHETNETEYKLLILTGRNRRSLQLKHHNYVKWESICSPRHFISSMQLRSTYLFNACVLHKCTRNAKCPWRTPTCKSCVFLSDRNSGGRSVKGLLDTKSIHHSDSKVGPLRRHHKIYQ
jgi:hypothetical protein